jgi:TolB-like protein/tetratricopeptide (TPR) repeat protein
MPRKSVIGLTGVCGMSLEPEIGAKRPDTLTVFLSYDRDDEQKAQVLVRALESQAFAVWWDGLISGGHAFADRIQEALAECDVVVVLWSEHSAHSHWVRDEAGFGRDRNRLVPVSIDGSKAPLGFQQLQSIDLSRWHGSIDAPEFEQLCRSIRSVAGMPVGAAARPGRAPRLSRRQTLAGAGATAVVLVGAGAGVTWLRGGAAANATRIAVLPFRNLSGDPSQDYFADGLAEELRATLSQADQLEVAAQASSDSVRDRKGNARSMAKALNVAFLIEGSVRRSPESVRVLSRIVDGKSGFDKWTQTFDRKAADSLAVQSDIAAFVTDALLAGLDKDKRPSERIGGTKESEAFDAFLRGSAAYRLTSGKESDLAALENFERAIGIDPNYAAAHAALSRTLTVFANNYATRAEIPDYYRRAIAAARSAVRLAPNMAEGHSALGFVLFNGQLDARGAAAPYQRSYELGYGNAEILSAYANFAGRIGRFDEGREAIARAQQLDPLNPIVFRNAGLLEYAARSFAAAENQFRTALSINPKARNVRAALGDIALIKGDLNAARSHFSEEGDRASRFRGLAIVDMKLGKEASAEANYAGLIKEGGDTVHYQQAQVLAQWGRKDDALTQLEQAFALRDAGLVRLRNDPLLDPVRKDARFAKIEQTIGFA